MQEGKWLTDIAQIEAVFSFPFFDEVLEEPITKETTGDKAMFRKPPVSVAAGGLLVFQSFQYSQRAFGCSASSVARAATAVAAPMIWAAS